MGAHLGHFSLDSPEGGLRSSIRLWLHPQPVLCPFLFSQYACGIEAEVVGKPSPEYFQSALKEMGVEAHEVGWSLRGVCVCGSQSVGDGPEHGLEGSGSLWRLAGQPGVDPSTHES